MSFNKSQLITIKHALRFYIENNKLKKILNTKEESDIVEQINVMLSRDSEKDHAKEIYTYTVGD